MVGVCLRSLFIMLYLQKLGERWEAHLKDLCLMFLMKRIIYPLIHQGSYKTNEDHLIVETSIKTLEVVLLRGEVTAHCIQTKSLVQ